jgi:glycosyltransferase involved in cell wall biosynthesis
MDSRGARIQTAVIDLAPLLPGGENGGAKILALNLVRHLAALAPDTRFILLVSRQSEGELSALDAPNVQRFCFDVPAAERPPAENARLIAADLLRRVLPVAAMDRIAGAYARANRPTLLRQLGADLLFCPFTAATFDDGETPFVSLVHDLQHRYLPQNFKPRLKDQLEQRLRQVIDHAARIVCVSDYVRETMLDAGARPERIETIHTALHSRIPAMAGSDAGELLAKWDLTRDGYLLYPANFWPHKNHANLLDAFATWRQRDTASRLKLVLTGAPGAERDRVIQLVQARGLAGRVIVPGFLPEEQFAGLVPNCLAVVFPSLYEGFGMPVVEAMAAGKPVLCSNAASLPEIAGGAALLFDPHDVAAMAQAIGQIEHDAGLRSSLVERGLIRAASFGDAQHMATRYWRSFQAALGTRC